MQKLYGTLLNNGDQLLCSKSTTKELVEDYVLSLHGKTLVDDHGSPVGVRKIGKTMMVCMINDDGIITRQRDNQYFDSSIVLNLASRLDRKGVIINLR
ncbi:hypothetical protein [Neptuniibacter sp. QD37_11]|uniref:hypothetical protein n=1 Tax=Neptuniibacter sp. QD37_11 TaxID=3398209 RepID=UPI0039F5426D